MTLIKTTALLTAALLALVATPAPAQDGPQPRLPVIELTAGMYRIQAEVALTETQQQIGMMFRRTMGENEGMLFANEEPGLRCFWMHNTLIPLTAAFIADDGTIVNLADMAPRTDTTHCSIKPVRFVLEMRQGWFAKRGMKAGLQLRGRPFGN
ncbi:MAG: DUF192 domain-containing protein [Burkholderiales bacterium]|nr:DUF192 domain-containing protein [Burkholderiales bacterium]MDE1927437.1 DUF192 domain-containing protein [Burkholderiales bacterium]MDE2504540.1 DUF192 domain-containing protein [Burkholderiales bacterium]